MNCIDRLRKEFTMLKKNDIINLNIESVTNEGNGIGRHLGVPVFVPNTVAGEQATVQIVKVLKNYCYGIAKEITQTSTKRIEPSCSVAKRCGGCSLRHVTYDEELNYKEQWVTDAMRRLGKTQATILPIIGSPKENHYRNKAQYPFGKDDFGKTICGFYAKRSHHLIPSSSCDLQPTFFQNICNIVCHYIDETNASIYNEATHTGLFKHLYIRFAEQTNEIMVCVVINGTSIPNPDLLVNNLLKNYPNIASIQLNYNTKKTNVILGDTGSVLYGKNEITDILCDIEIDISPLSFYQVNKQGAEKLYSVAEKFAEISDNTLFLDLYCGAGTIGLSILNKHKKAKLIGVEIIENAVRNAQQNAERAGLDNAEFICSDAGTAATELAKKRITPEVIIVDPPRKGCDLNTINAIVAMKPQRVVMVSCNAATAARDIQLLEQSGYRAELVQPLDMFPRTIHVECVIKLSREIM